MTTSNKKLICARNIKYKPCLDMELTQKLEEAGIIFRTYPHSLLSIEFTHYNQKISGIGVRNIHGGFEFSSKDNLAISQTLKRKGITLIPYIARSRSASLCIFESTMDYLSYFCLAQQFILELPQYCDCLIVGDVSNFVQSILEIDIYERVNCFFTMTDVGRTMLATLKSRDCRKIVDYSNLYFQYVSLSGYAKSSQNS